MHCFIDHCVSLLIIKLFALLRYTASGYHLLHLQTIFDVYLTLVLHSVSLPVYISYYIILQGVLVPHNISDHNILPCFVHQNILDHNIRNSHLRMNKPVFAYFRRPLVVYKILHMDLSRYTLRIEGVFVLSMSEILSPLFRPVTLYREVIAYI